jgi:hypothetical protein
MPDRRLCHLPLSTTLVDVAGAGGGVVLDADGRIALLHRGRGARAQLCTETAQQLVRGLLAVLPALAERDQATADAVADRLAEIEAGPDAA